MKIVRWLQKLIVFIYCLIKYSSFKLAYNLSFYKVSIPNLGMIYKSGDQIVFKKTGNKIYYTQLPNFLFNLDMLFNLLNADFVKVTTATPEYFVANINGLTFKVSSLSNMGVLYEIFIQKIYEIELFGEDIIGIDIGMNIGAASHYFANFSNVKLVYGFEPFPATFDEAIFNSSLNPQLASKLVQQNIGVSDFTGDKTITLFESGLLSASTTNMNNTYGRVDGININVNLISIKDLLENVIQKHPNNPLFLKIDCEGEEYAIFESLQHTHLLDNVDCILVEWHEKGADPIVKFLKENGFQFHHIPNETLNCGMIYAFRLKSK